MSSAAQIVRIAQSQIGIKEYPPNSNRTKYGREYGMDGQPWCAMFVWWVFKHADCSNLFYGGKKSAYCPAIADYYISHNQTINKKHGHAGDIVLFDWNKNNSSDHIGIIEKKNSDGSYTTIEGNTSLSNNSNGGQVMRRKRYLSEISWICRPRYTVKDHYTDHITVDGYWGKATTKKSQKELHVKVTNSGKIYFQRKSDKKYLLNIVKADWDFKSTLIKRSVIVKAIQKRIGIKQTGYMNKYTIESLQEFLKRKNLYKGRVDGYLGKKTVSGWQTYINRL